MKINVVLNGKAATLRESNRANIWRIRSKNHVMSVRRAESSRAVSVPYSSTIDPSLLHAAGGPCRRQNRRDKSKVSNRKSKRSTDCFGAEGADQCGFCNPGIALTAYALKKEYGTPTDDEIKHYLVGNLCRCSGYEAQLKAITCYLGVEKT